MKMAKASEEDIEMTPEDKELVERLRAKQISPFSLDEVAAAIERLSAEVETLKTTPAHLREDMHCVISDLCQQVRDRDAELAALRKQIAEAQPVAWMTKTGGWVRITDDPKNPDNYDMPLYLHPAADAKDAARYRWLRDSGCETWTPLIRRGMTSTAEKIDAAIDAAMKGESDVQRI